MSKHQDSNKKLGFDFCGMHFNTPLVLLSGCIGFGDEYTRVEGFSYQDVGAVCLKGITLEPRLGNPTHRVAETPCGMLNAIGLQNPGVKSFISDVLPTLDYSVTRYIANISGSTVEEYAALAKHLDDSPIDAIEINISCPNVKKGGMEFGNDPDTSAEVVESCRAQTSKPLITKLSPNQNDIAHNARLCIEAGSDAFSLINTISGMAIDTQTRAPVLGNVSGGLSGPAIKPIALLKVYEVYQVCKERKIPLIGQGGISSSQDIIEFMLAGSDAVGIGTGLFYDPLLCQQVIPDLEDYLAQHQFSHISELVGALS